MGQTRNRYVALWLALIAAGCSDDNAENSNDSTTDDSGQEDSDAAGRRTNTAGELGSAGGNAGAGGVPATEQSGGKASGSDAGRTADMTSTSNAGRSGSDAKPPQGSGERCPALTVLARDGKFLGNATSNASDSGGVCNASSGYGSESGSNSIFNASGMYGSEFSSKSAYNEFTSTPPRLYCARTERFLNPITKNTLLADRIDPDDLCARLQAIGY